MSTENEPPADVHLHQAEVLKRLRRAKGHLEKVIEMIEEDAPCVGVAQQLQAVHAAIGKAKNLLVRDHIEHCMDPASLGDIARARMVVEELREISKYL